MKWNKQNFYEFAMFLFFLILNAMPVFIVIGLAYLVSLLING